MVWWMNTMVLWINTQLWRMDAYNLVYQHQEWVKRHNGSGEQIDWFPVQFVLFWARHRFGRCACEYFGWPICVSGWSALGFWRLTNRRPPNPKTRPARKTLQWQNRKSADNVWNESGGFSVCFVDKHEVFARFSEDTRPNPETRAATKKLHSYILKNMRWKDLGLAVSFCVCE